MGVVMTNPLVMATGAPCADADLEHPACLTHKGSPWRGPRGSGKENHGPELPPPRESCKTFAQSTSADSTGQSVSRVLRAVVSDPGPSRHLARLPPFLRALEEIESDVEDGPPLVGFDMGRNLTEEKSKPGGNFTADGLNDPIHGATETNDLEATTNQSKPIESHATCEKLFEYSRHLEQRVERLQKALRHSEAARERDLLVQQASATQAGIKTAESRELCCICIAAPRECAFTPCGHRCVCRICGIGAVRVDRRCPICRTVAGRVLRIIDP